MPVPLKLTLTESERRELDQLRAYDRLCSLGDRPQSPAVAKLRRLAELEALDHLEAQLQQAPRP